MAYNKMKSENYSNIGGINEKASIYKVDEKEVLNLVNFDFSEPGAWTKRWGFTSSLAASTLTIGVSGVISNIWQVYKYGAGIADLPETIPRNKLLIGHNQGVFKADLNNFAADATIVYQSFVSGFSPANWNFANYNDQSYFTSGSTYPLFKYRPTTFPTSISDEAAFFGMVGAPAVASGLTFTTLGTTTSGLTGTYNYQYAYMDGISFIGPRSATFTASTAGNPIVISGFTVLGSAASFGYFSTAIFRDRVPGFASTDMVLYSFTGATFTDPNLQQGTFLDPIISNTVDFEGNPAFSFKNSRVLEFYQNRLFLDQGNNIWFSEIGEPQNFQPENFFRISNDRFQITGLKEYNQSLLIFCEKGVFRLTGDNPENFNVQKLTTEYGCVSHRSIVVWHERLWFLDQQGVVEFDGANFKLVSNRMDDTFKSINIAKARNYACGIHVPDRNEVWFSFPSGSSNINNTTCVYDYLSDGWTTFASTKLNPTAISEIYDGIVYRPTLAIGSIVSTNKKLYFGSIGASMFNFSPSLTSDDGIGITTVFRTRNHTELGKSSTSQFRRFYLDTGPYMGPTLTFQLNFYANYASSVISLTRSLYSAQPSNRIDFGIPAKALSVEVVHGSTTGILKLYGYTIESRYQRSV